MARIVVGECPSCGQQLRVKTTGVKGTMNLTCRCGTRTRIEATANLRSIAMKEEQKQVTLQHTSEHDKTKREAHITGRGGFLDLLKERIHQCRWLLGFYLVYLVSMGSILLIGMLGGFNGTDKGPPAIFYMALLFCCIGLLGCTISAYKYAETLNRDGGRWGLFVFLFIFIAPLILSVMPKAVDIGQKCMTCGKNVEGRDNLMALQSYAVQAGLTQKARDMEKDQGYVCQICGYLYCKVCLEGRVSNPQKGADCPSCGGSFGYLS